ncbi:MAG: NUDIX hydrolase [Hellea sp.]
MKNLFITSLALALAACSAPTSSDDSAAEPLAANVLEGAWNETQTQALLDKTMRLRFPYQDSGLTSNEQAAVKELLSAGARLHSLYLEQRHPQGRAAEMALATMKTREDLKEVFRIMKGPIATTLENKRDPFLNVSAPTDTGNVYPIGTDRETMDAFLAANPDLKNDILHLRAVVKSANEAEKTAALATLKAYPALDVLHPGLRAKIETAEGYFSLPYSVEYAEDIFFIYDRLNAAAKHIEGEDIAFARFLKARARDILADDYDGGDAAWITGDFKGNLNAQIGSYETYDDALYGVKSYFSLSLLQRDKVKSDELAASIGDIQAIEDALPYKAQKQVRSNIPVGVYSIISDFGQARGTNTATILPNEGHLSRQYGRTILIRSTVLTNERIFEEALTSFKAAVLDKHHDDLVLEGNFYRTLWHEIGHYLGPDQTKTGGDIDGALQDSADLLEEMKSDLVSLFSAEKLNASGAFSDQQFRAIYAAGILRVLQKNRPRRSQAYGTMQLIQWNWFMDKGLLSFEDGKLEIHYQHYSKAVSSLLTEVLDLQYQGDRDTANAFIDKWTSWDEDMHGVIAAAMKDAEGARYRYVTYEALGE